MNDKHIKTHLVFCVTALGIDHRLHAPWHRFVERLEVRRSDVVPNLLRDSFQPSDRCCSFVSLQVLHLAPQVFNGIEIWTVSRPTLEELNTSILVPFLRRFGPMRGCAIFHEAEKLFFLHFFPPAKSICFLLSALISKRIKIQEPAWSHSIDLSQTRILKKKSSLCDEN